MALMTGAQASSIIANISLDHSHSRCCHGRQCMINATSFPPPWNCSLLLSVPCCQRHAALRPRLLSTAKPSGRIWCAEGSITLCTDNVNICSYRAKVSAKYDLSIAYAKASGSGIKSRSRNDYDRKRFNALRPQAKPRVQLEPRTEDDQQRPPPEPIGKLEPSIDRYLQYLSDYKIVYDTMEEIVRQAPHPSYAIFWNSGLERSVALAKDFEWFRSKGHIIPEPNKLGRTYAQRLKYLSEHDPPAFIYSVYNVFYAHSAGGRFIGRKVAGLILDGRELNFYQFNSDILDLIDAARDKLHKLKATWPKETRDRMLKETRLSYKWSADLVRKYIRVYDNELPEIHEDVSLP